MPAYCFCFHALDERVLGEERHSLSNDDAAVKFAQTLLSQHAIVMVWGDKRFVKRVTRPEQDTGREDLA